MILRFSSFLIANTLKAKGLEGWFKNATQTLKKKSYEQKECSTLQEDILHSPGSWTIECHADSKNMILSKPASTRSPPEPVSPRVLDSDRGTVIHPIGRAVNGSPNLALYFSPMLPLLLLLLYSVGWAEGESPLPNLIGATHHTQHSWRAFCNQLTSESHVGWTSVLSFTVYVPSSMFTWSVCLECTCASVHNTH